MGLTEIFIILYIAWNIILFFIYGLDKRKAKHGRRRISEKALITGAFLLGALGAILGMKIFRHKTNHLKFKICLPVALIINLIVIFYIRLLLKPIITPAIKSYQ